MELVWFTEAIYPEEFKVFFKFNNGVEGIIDIKDKMYVPVFEPVKNTY